MLDLLRTQHQRELEHWRLATERLGDLELLAPASAWESLEHYVGIALRHALAASVARLRAQLDRLDSRLRTARTVDGDRAAAAELNAFRLAFQRTETTLDFYGDALATRASPATGRLLRACDHIAQRGMAEILTPLGRQVPAVLTFLDKGLGASILKAGLRLWDPGTENPVAAIKVVRHNLLRPTAILHESGHQVAHALGWNGELARAIDLAIRSHGTELAALWAGWASETAGDAIAFAHVGYAAVAAVHDVVGGDDLTVHSWIPGDPHPPGFLRVLLGTAMCRHCYGPGPWDELEGAWIAEHAPDHAPAESRALIAASIPLLPCLAAVCLDAAFEAFGDRPLRACVDPARVSPDALAELERAAGKAATSSTYWLWNESIRLLAMTGFRCGLNADGVRSGITTQRALMDRLGEMRTPNHRRTHDDAGGPRTADRRHDQGRQRPCEQDR